MKLDLDRLERLARSAPARGCDVAMDPAVLLALVARIRHADTQRDEFAEQLAYLRARLDAKRVPT